MRGLRVRILPGLPFLFSENGQEATRQFILKSINEEVLDYIRESRAELKKVTWPTKQQLWYSTIIVIVVSAIASAYLGLVDLILTGIFSKIIQ